MSYGIKGTFHTNSQEPIVLISSKCCTQWHPIGSLKLAIVEVIYTMETGKPYKTELLLSVGFSESQFIRVPPVMNIECVLV